MTKKENRLEVHEYDERDYFGFKGFVGDFFGNFIGSFVRDFFVNFIGDFIGLN